jgi:shikimate kinase/3-dehydroquinate synthase
MHIFLYGPPGSGKSTVGKGLAQSLNLPFFDLDGGFETSVSWSIAQYLNEQGELGFREAESALLKKTVGGEEKVIALGGGSLLQAGNRALAESTGQVILLEAELSTLAKRFDYDRDQRPLLAGALETKLTALLENRGEHYDSFPLRMDASPSPEQVSWNIQRLLGRYHLRGMGVGYDVIVQEDGIDQLGEMLKARKLGGPVLVVSDANVAPLFGERVQKSLHTAGYEARQLVVPAGEASKNLDTLAALWRGSLEAELDRKSTILALGGGVIGDLAGFVAATFMRGCNWVVVPTTLLAMVDASLGGKTGIDLLEGKNLVGAFYPPRLVLADPDVLSTLPERELRAGLAEVVKHGVVADPVLFDLCARGWETVTSRLPEVVRRGIAVKARVIEEDPYEQGIRAVLNFGHTVGHAVELVSGFRLLHGEAVAIGMVAEARFAERLGVADSGMSDALARTFLNLGLPVEIPKNLGRDEIINAMKMDKKRTSGVVRFALPVKIGEVQVGVEVESLERAL